MSSKKNKSRNAPLGSIPLETNKSNYEAPTLDAMGTDDLVELFQSVKITDPNDPNVENEFIDWEKERDEMNRFFDHQSKNQLKNLPRFKQPPGFKSNAKLFPHQKDGIRWLLSQERNPRPNPFFREQELKDGSKIFRDRTTGIKLDGPYLPVKGAILADGKLRTALFE